MILLYHWPGADRLPPALSRVTAELGLCVEVVPVRREVVRRAAHGQVGVLVDAARDFEYALELVRTLKEDVLTAVTPVIVWTNGRSGGAVVEALDAGADEVLPATMAEAELIARTARALARAGRDLAVHPSTRLPGTVEIDRDLMRRLAEGSPFAACYVDLDHFKEFNDRYGYTSGDAVIQLTASLLRRIVRGHSADPFVGHIGGDDFIFHVRANEVDTICGEIVRSFDEAVRTFYSSEDRERGGFPGNDRRGVEYFVPLMTISIGVASAGRRPFSHPGEVHRVLREMKELAKRTPGSVYLVDRRRVPVAPAPTAFADRDLVNA